MYRQSVNFDLPISDYERIKDLAHATRNTMAGLLREGAVLVIEKYKPRSQKQDGIKCH